MRLINEEKTRGILRCALQVHRALGPGLLEGSYRQCLLHELRAAGMKAESEVHIPLRYKGFDLECGYRADIIVDRQVLLELKTVETLLPIHTAQTMTYLKLSGMRIGLLMNFNSVLLRHGVRRIVL